MTAIPSTARTLTDLSTVAPADAALMLLRSGSTDGKTTIATLINYILGPQLAACIGGAGTAESFALTTSWAVIDFTTATVFLSLATTDGAGTITAGLTSAVVADVSWSLNATGASSHDVEATVYVDGAAVGSVHRAKLTTDGKTISGGAIVEIEDGDTIQVALRMVSGSASIDVDSLSIRVRFIPRVTAP